MRPTGVAERYVMGSGSRKGHDLSKILAQSRPAVRGATAIREFVVETAERRLAHRRRLRWHDLVFVSASKAGEWRAFLEAVLAREAAGRGGRGDQ